MPSTWRSRLLEGADVDAEAGGQSMSATCSTSSLSPSISLVF